MKIYALGEWQADCRSNADGILPPVDGSQLAKRYLKNIHETAVSSASRRMIATRKKLA
jgi:hypothetical protein